MTEKFMIVRTKRKHDQDRVIRIESQFEGTTGVHPYDTEVPEQESHQVAAVTHLDWKNVPSELVGYADDGDGYLFMFRRTL